MAKPPVRVAIVSDIAKGGAAIALRRLYDGIHAQLDAKWLHCGSGSGMNVQGWSSLAELLCQRLCLRISRRLGSHYERGLRERHLVRALRLLRPQVINLHNLHQSYGSELLEKLPSQSPIVWTMHDTWPLTGYCCYCGNCRMNIEGCKGDCPELGNWGKAESPSEGWRKRDNWIRHNAKHLVLAAPSRWMANEAVCRFGGSVEVRCIPYGLPLDIFKPIASRNEIRRALGFKEDNPMVLFVSSELGDPRKGADILKKAIRCVQGGTAKEVQFVCVGNGAFEHDGLKVKVVPTIHDEQMLNLYYNAADVFVHPARQDNLPNTLLEALAAGTPSVAFNIGGCGDIVRSRQTGWLVDEVDATTLANALLHALSLSDDDALQYRAKCRKIAETEFDSGLQAERYIKLFEELIERTS